MANPVADENTSQYLVKVEEMKTSLKKNNLYFNNSRFYAAVHEWLLVIKEKGRNLEDNTTPNEVSEKFKLSSVWQEKMSRTISEISQSQSTGERLVDLIMNSSKSTLLQRFRNTIGLDDDEINQANGLGAGVLDLVGGAVKETKKVNGSGGPISEKTLDLAIKATEELFYDLQDDFYRIPKDERNGVYKDWKSMKDEKQSREDQWERERELEAEKEKNLKLKPADVLELQRKKLTQHIWSSDTSNIKHHLYTVMERNFDADADLRNFILYINKDGTHISGLQGTCDRDFNERLEDAPLSKYKEDVFFEIAIGKIAELKTQLSETKSELLDIIANKLADLKSQNDAGYKELMDLLVRPSMIWVDVVCPLGNILLENTKTLSDVVNEDLANTKAFTKAELDDMMKIVNNGKSQRLSEGSGQQNPIKMMGLD